MGAHITRAFGKRKAVMSTGFAVLMAALLAFLALGGPLQQAQAYSGSAYLQKGEKISYSGYSTTALTIEGNTGYCITPKKQTPASGTYNAVEAYTLWDSRDGSWDVQCLKNALYYGYGGPGFDQNAWYWPKTNWKGQAPSWRDYYVWTHMILADVYTHEGYEAMHGTSASYKKWTSQYILGFGEYGATYNNDSVEHIITNATGRIANAPDWFNKSCFIIKGNGSSQDTMGWKKAVGYLNLHKSSSNASISDSNSCYDLAGAQYDIYSNDGTYVTTLKTDSNGDTGTTGELQVGDYKVVEKTPAKGFAIDTEEHWVTVTAGETTTVQTTDAPQNDPSGALVQKLDAITGKSSPQGNGTLEGAQFTVKFYGNSDGDTSGTPLKTWVYETDENGYISFDADSPISGENYTSNGYPVFPLGTYTVQETKAPNGYNLPEDTAVHTAQVKSTGDGESDAKWTYDDSWNKIELNGSEAGGVTDKVQQGDFRIVKEATPYVDNENPNGDNNNASGNDRVIVPGIQFQLINESANAVVSPQTGEEVQKDGTVYTITTDENGLASTKNAAANGWNIPDGWTGALAFGTYKVHEVVPSDVNDAFKAKYGHDVPTVNDFTVNITSEGQYDAPMLANDKSQMPLKIVKADAETGKQVPEVCSFQLYDSKGKLVTYTSHYPDEQTMDTWTTNSEGNVTLPFLLNPGTYTVKEVNAPDGYALNATGVKFTVDSTFHTWDDPLTLTYKDMPIKGTITVVKTDSDTGKAVAGAVYEVKAAKDVVTPDGTKRASAGDVVATLTTGKDGTATTGKLYLGTYTVTEKSSPNGYALDATPHTVTIKSEGQNVPVVSTKLAVKDAPTKLDVLKSDVKTGAALAGATFRLWDPAADPTYGLGSAADLVKAVNAADGYANDKVNTQGLDDELASAKPGDTLQVSFNGGTAAVTDGTTALPPALRMFDVTINDDNTMTVKDGDTTVCTVPAKVVKAGDPKAYSQTATSNDKGLAEFKNVPHGTYKFAEVSCPDGYYFDQSGTERTVTVNDQGLIGIADSDSFASTLKIELANTPIEIHTTATVDGAHTADTSTETTLDDVVNYTGLTPGKEYTVTGTLHEVAYDENGTAYDAGALKDADGNDVTASTTFTPEESEGSVTVTFTFDSSQLAGQDVVAFETAQTNGKTVATHADITDQDQTVHFNVNIHTTLTDTQTSTHTAPSIDGKCVLMDTVSYDGLVEGKTYTVTGQLMNKGTGDVLTDSEGNPVTGTATFTATGKTGTVDVYFEFDANQLGGNDTVAFEELYEGDSSTPSDSDEQTDQNTPIAEHRDLNDEDQTVHFPSVHTNATDADDGDQEATADDEVKINDEVSYTGLTPGRNYTVTGTLMDKGTGDSVKDADGNPVTATTTFTPDAADGSVTVTFEFDGSSIADHDTVAFEELYDADTNTLIGEHKDIEDEGQTVHLKSPDETPVGEALDKTGDWLRANWPIAAIIAAVAVAGGAYGWRKHRLAMYEEHVA